VVHRDRDHGHEDSSFELGVVGTYIETLVSARRGFSATLSPSPTALSNSTSAKIAAPGKAGTHHAVVALSSPFVSICPRLTTFGSPTPRKLSDASVRMA